MVLTMLTSVLVSHSSVFATRPRVPLDDGVTSMEDNSVTSLKDDGDALLVTVQKNKPFCIFKGQNQAC